MSCRRRAASAGSRCARCRPACSPSIRRGQPADPHAVVAHPLDVGVGLQHAEHDPQVGRDRAPAARSASRRRARSGGTGRRRGRRGRPGSRARPAPSSAAPPARRGWPAPWRCRPPAARPRAWPARRRIRASAEPPGDVGLGAGVGGVGEEEVGLVELDDDAGAMPLLGGLVEKKAVMSLTRAACCMLWVTMTIVYSSLRSSIRSSTLRGGDRVERRAGLVHQQHLGLDGERAGDAEPLLLAAGERQRRALAAGPSPRPRARRAAATARPARPCRRVMPSMRGPKATFW